MKNTLMAGLSVVAGVGLVVLADPNPATGQPADPLAGPKVAARENPGIVERDAGGKVVRLERSPAAVAVEKLPLGEADRKAADKVLLERSASLDRLVRENLLELAGAANAFQSGNKAEGMRLLGELRKQNKALDESSKLPQQLSAVLPKAEGVRLREMVQEYIQAVIQEESDAATAAGKRPNPGVYALAENLRIMGMDLKAAYERVIGQQTKEFEETLQGLNLTAAQENKVRAIVGDAFRAVKGKYSAADKAQVFWKVWGELEPGQRRELSRRMREEQKGK